MRLVHLKVLSGQKNLAHPSPVTYFVAYKLKGDTYNSTFLSHTTSFTFKTSTLHVAAPKKNKINTLEVEGIVTKDIAKQISNNF